MRSTRASIEFAPFREGDSLAREWDDFANRVGSPPFLRPGWFAAWQRAFHSSGGVQLLCSRRDGRLVGIAPLIRARGVTASVSNWHSPMYGCIVEHDADARDLAAAMFASPARRLDLAFLPADGALASEVRTLAKSQGLTMIERVIQRSPYVELGGDWEYFEKGLPTKRRSDLRRRRKRLEEQGVLRFETSDGRRGLEYLLEEGFMVEALGWKGSRGSAIASQPRTIRFYTDVARWAASRDWLKIWFLRLDQRAVAFALCFVHQGVLYVLKIGFDPAFARFGPGTLLTREMFAAAFAGGLKRYEFLGQPDPYKLVWADHVHEFTRLQVFSASPSGRMARLAWQWGRPLAARVRGSMVQR